MGGERDTLSRISRKFTGCSTSLENGFKWLIDNFRDYREHYFLINLHVMCADANLLIMRTRIFPTAGIDGTETFAPIFMFPPDWDK
jgi:hypothetical protein